MSTPSRKQIEEVQRWLRKAKELIVAGVTISERAVALQAELDAARTEMEITPWLKRNPDVVAKLAHGCYPHVFQSLPIGTKHPDFVVLDSFSGGWEVTMIELEPPTAPLFTKAGNPAKRLAGAIMQVDDWRTYVGKHRQEVLTRLSEYYKSKDLLKGPRDFEPKDCGMIPLADPRSEVIWHYIIVIGRRAKLSAEHIARKAAFYENHRITVATYDRLVQITDQIECLPFYHY